MRRTFMYSIIATLILGLSTFAFGELRVKETAKLSGSVTSIITKGGKTIGNVKFEGRTSGGEKYRGSGKVEIIFDSTKKTVRKMVISFRGTRGNKTVNGKFTSSKSVTFANPVTSKFEFSQIDFLLGLPGDEFN